jgi:hypothetical protein
MKTIFLSLLFLSSVTWAGILNVVPGVESMSGVKINKHASIVSLENKTVELNPAGQPGIVTKKVLIVTADVYVGQMYVSDLSKYPMPNAQPLASIDNPTMQVIAMQMTFLHSASAEQIHDAFRDGLAANKVANPDVQEYLTKVLAAGDITKGDGSQTLTVVGERLFNGQEVVRYENSHTGVVQTIRPHYKGFIRDLYSCWLGTLATSGLKKFKKALTGIDPQQEKPPNHLTTL